MVQPLHRGCRGQNCQMVHCGGSFVVEAAIRAGAHYPNAVADGRQIENLPFEDIDQLADVDAGDPLGILIGHLDLDHPGVFGVSLGGRIAAESCLHDARLKACLVMDDPAPADVVAVGLSQPTMFLSRDAETMRLERQRSGGWTEHDIATTLGTMRAAYTKLTGGGYYVDIPNLFHVNFTVHKPRWRRQVPSTSARDPSLLWATLAGVIPGLVAAAFVHLHRLAVGRPITDDERIGRYLFWLAMGASVALTVSFIAVAAIPRSGAAVGLLTGSAAAAVAALETVAGNTFLIGNILDLSFWWSTIVATTTLWLAGYLLMLPLTLAVWPAPWRNVPGWLLMVIATLASGIVALGLVALAVAAP